MTKEDKLRTEILFCKICKDELGVEVITEHKFHETRRWRFDYAIVDLKIALEVEGGVWTGGRHTSGAGFTKDTQKYNSATLLGWRVFRVVPSTLITEETFQMLKEAINYKQ